MKSQRKRSPVRTRSMCILDNDASVLNPKAKEFYPERVVRETPIAELELQAAEALLRLKFDGDKRHKMF